MPYYMEYYTLVDFYEYVFILESFTILHIYYLHW